MRLLFCIRRAQSPLELWNVVQKQEAALVNNKKYKFMEIII